uniref:Uncharacterized protein n=1 Tax=Oncorhynchus tshawytscha TaxID=74940 RepID=A0AAZ3Q7E5_ONCTS
MGLLLFHISPSVHDIRGYNQTQATGGMLCIHVGSWTWLCCAVTNRVMVIQTAIVLCHALIRLLEKPLLASCRQYRGGTSCWHGAALQATRALMIVGIIVTVAGLGVATMGMKCTNCGGDDKNKKSRIAMTGGIVLLIGSLCATIACSWYANNIIKEFYNPFAPVNSKYEFGSAIFIAWAGAFLDIIGGAMLAATCPKGKPKVKYPIASTRPTSSSKEYV